MESFIHPSFNGSGGLVHWCCLKREHKDQQADRRIKMAKYLMTRLSFFFHEPFNEWRNICVPISLPELWRERAAQETKRGREKVKMREIYEWSLGSRPRCSNACQSFASEHRNKSVLAPLIVHPLIQLPLSAVERDTIKRTHFKAVLYTHVWMQMHACILHYSTEMKWSHVCGNDTELGLE